MCLENSQVNIFQTNSQLQFTAMIQDGLDIPIKWTQHSNGATFVESHGGLSQYLN